MPILKGMGTPEHKLTRSTPKYHDMTEQVLSELVSVLYPLANRQMQE